MVVTIVNIWVKTQFIEDFIQATKINHLSSVKETGNVRFDVCQDENDPSKFTLYEAYISEEASIQHKKTQHYLIWRDTVKDWMSKPREGVKHKILFPENL
jgi:autoinducer 2-degrading protein